MKQYKVKSETDPNKTYIVRETDKGFKCSCPHFVVREKYIGVCKHIRSVIRGTDDGQ